MKIKHEAVDWVPLFPAEEIPFILDAVLRGSATLRKKHATEHENHISNKLRKRLIQDVALRQRPIHLDPEAYVYDGDIKKARTSVGNSIEANHKKLKTIPPFKLTPSSVLPRNSRVSETIHALPQGDFVIYHVFVAVLDD